MFIFLRTKCNEFLAKISATSRSVIRNILLWRGNHGKFRGTDGSRHLRCPCQLSGTLARTVEDAMNSALEAIIGVTDSRTLSLPGEVFLLEPRINEMEIVIDEHAIRLLRRGSFPEQTDSAGAEVTENS